MVEKAFFQNRLLPKSLKLAPCTLLLSLAPRCLGATPKPWAAQPCCRQGESTRRGNRMPSLDWVLAYTMVHHGSDLRGNSQSGVLFGSRQISAPERRPDRYAPVQQKCAQGASEQWCRRLNGCRKPNGCKECLSFANKAPTAVWSVCFSFCGLGYK